MKEKMQLPLVHDRLFAIADDPGNHVSIKKVFSAVMNLAKMAKPLGSVKRVKALHKLSERAVIKDLSLNLPPTCTDKCSNCCHMNIAISPDESVFYAKKIRDGDIVYDKEEFEKQKTYDSDKFHADPRPCIFLKDNSCSIYKDRPMACRKYYVVVDDPEVDCKITPFVNRKVAMLSMVDTEIIYAAMTTLSSTKGNNSMPFMIDKALKGGFRK